jgi:hypothetical protein
MSKAQPGSGYGFTSSGYGFTLNTEQPFPTSGAATQIKFLYAYVAGDKVSVSPGTVNQYIPQISGIYLDAATPPAITIEGPGYVLVKVTYESGKFFPRTATIIYHSGTTIPASTNEESYLPLGRVNEVSSGGTTTYTMTTLNYGNIVVNRLKAGANTATWWWQTV